MRAQDHAQNLYGIQPTMQVGQSVTILYDNNNGNEVDEQEDDDEPCRPALPPFFLTLFLFHLRLFTHYRPLQYYQHQYPRNLSHRFLLLLPP